MSTILKRARWEFTDGPLKNHWGFVGESIGWDIDAIELSGGRGRYEKVGKSVEDCPMSDDGKRVVYEMIHVSPERQSAPTGAKEPENQEGADRPLGGAACSDSSIRDPRTGKLALWKAFQQYWENGGEAECNDIFTKHGGLKAAVEEGFIRALIMHGNLATQDCPAPQEATLRVSFDLVIPASVSRQSGISQPCSTCRGAT